MESTTLSKGAIQVPNGALDGDVISNPEENELAIISGEDVALANLGQIDVSKLQWKTKEGEWIPLGLINDSHLRNIALMLMGMGYQSYRAPDRLKVLWLTAIKMEWERRMLAKASVKK